MKRIVAVLSAALLGLPAGAAAVAEPPSLQVSIPLYFGAHPAPEPAHVSAAADIRMEHRLRTTRYAFQLADAIVSAIGYHAYAKCLSCLAYPGGGPRGSATFSVANLSGDRPAEVDPLVQPFSRGGFAGLALSALAYDFADARIERRWSLARRETADIAEIAAHAWGISTWLPELANIHRATVLAAACGAQWQAKSYGEAFSDGCVNAYYRPGPPGAAPPSAGNVITVCAPARFERGAYLFTTPGDYVVASGVPCGAIPATSP